MHAQTQDVLTWRAHGTEKAHVDELLERSDILPIVPTAVVHELADELEWGLRPVPSAEHSVEQRETQLVRVLVCALDKKMSAEYTQLEHVV